MVKVDISVDGITWDNFPQVKMPIKTALSTTTGQMEEHIALALIAARRRRLSPSTVESTFELGTNDEADDFITTFNGINSGVQSSSQKPDELEK